MGDLVRALFCVMVGCVVAYPSILGVPPPSSADLQKFRDRKRNLGIDEAAVHRHLHSSMDRTYEKIAIMSDGPNGLSAEQLARNFYSGDDIASDAALPLGQHRNHAAADPSPENENTPRDDSELAMTFADQVDESLSKPALSPARRDLGPLPKDESPELSSQRFNPTDNNDPLYDPMPSVSESSSPVENSQLLPFNPIPTEGSSVLQNETISKLVTNQSHHHHHHHHHHPHELEPSQTQNHALEPSQTDAVITPQSFLEMSATTEDKGFEHRHHHRHSHTKDLVNLIGLGEGEGSEVRGTKGMGMGGLGTGGSGGEFQWSLDGLKEEDADRIDEEMMHLPRSVTGHLGEELANLDSAGIVADATGQNALTRVKELQGQLLAQSPSSPSSPSTPSKSNPLAPSGTSQSVAGKIVPILMAAYKMQQGAVGSMTIMREFFKKLQTIGVNELPLDKVEQLHLNQAVVDKFKKMAAFANDPLGGQAGDGYFNAGDMAESDCNAYLDQYLSQCNHLSPQITGMIEMESTVTALTPGVREMLRQHYKRPASVERSLARFNSEQSLAATESSSEFASAVLKHFTEEGTGNSTHISEQEQNPPVGGTRPKPLGQFQDWVTPILDLIAYIILKMSEGKGVAAREAWKRFRLIMQQETIVPHKITLGSINDKTDWYLQQAIMGEAIGGVPKLPDSYDPFGPAGPEPGMMATGENNRWCHDIAASLVKRCIMPEQI